MTNPLGLVTNVWDTPISLIDPDEFCIWCEHSIGGHYTNCNRSSLSLKKDSVTVLSTQFFSDLVRDTNVTLSFSLGAHVELAGASLKYHRGRTFGSLSGMAPLREVW